MVNLTRAGLLVSVAGVFFLYSSCSFGFRINESHVVVYVEGHYLADNSLWIAIVSILASFEIKKPVRSDGKEVTP